MDLPFRCTAAVLLLSLFRLLRLLAQASQFAQSAQSASSIEFVAGTGLAGLSLTEAGTILFDRRCVAANDGQPSFLEADFPVHIWAILLRI